MSNIAVYIDYRESELIGLLRTGGTEIQTPNLDVGDIMISIGDDPVLILERKTLADLAASNRDGRYREQRARLLAMRGQGIAIGYLLEVGSGWSAEMNRVWPGNVQESTLASLVFRLSLRYGIPVIESRDAKTSTGIVRQLTKMVTADPEVFKGGIAGDATAVAAAYTEALSAQKSANRNLKRVGAGMLQAIPGVGAKISEMIMDKIETIEGLCKLSQEELAGLSLGKRTVGKMLGEKIWNALHCGAK